jgi:superfamily I DNA/RNA helicase
MPDYYFNLPSFDDLNNTQRAAVLDDNAIALSGGPGTGKSVVSLWRHILNHQREDRINSQLLTFTTSLALYLKECCRSQNNNASTNVDSSKHWVYNNPNRCDEIIHDEAQDLPLSFNTGLRRFSRRISYGADNQQLLTSSARNPDGTYNIERCSPEESLRNEFQNSLHTLSRNYRNSRRIMKLARRVFHNAAIPLEIIESCPIEGEYPRLLITGNNYNNINQAVLQLVSDFAENEAINIAVLVPFENPNRIAEETATVQYYYDLLSNNDIDCSRYTNGMGGIQEIKNIHVTTFKSAKGLEFDVVIIPDFNLVNLEFRVVDWRDFYVGVTRTKSNLFLLSRYDFPNLSSEGISKVIDKVIL